jgi:hypothetical protein
MFAFVGHFFSPCCKLDFGAFFLNLKIAKLDLSIFPTLPGLHLVVAMHNKTPLQKGPTQKLTPSIP